MHSEKYQLNTMDWRFAKTKMKNRKLFLKLTSKKVYKLIPSIWPTFSQIHPRELLKLHFDMLQSFSLVIISQRFLWFLWISIWSFFFSRQKFLIKDQFEFGLNPHEVLQFFQTLFKNQNSSFRPSGRHFISWNHIMFLCCGKNAEFFSKVSTNH